MTARSVWRHLGLVAVGLAFVAPASAAFAADPTPSPAPAVSGTIAQPGVDLSQGTLRLLAPALGAAGVDCPDDGPAIVLRSSISHVSAAAVPGTGDTATSGYAIPVWVAGAVAVDADRSTTGSRAPPAGR
jgi:hypothetical protein